jgi:hypothetical protein
MFADDYDFIMNSCIIAIDTQHTITDMEAKGIIEMRPMRNRDTGRWATPARWDKPTAVRDMRALFDDLNPVGMLVGEAYDKPTLILRFDGFAVNEAVQRAQLNELQVRYRTEPSTTTGFLEVTGTDKSRELVPMVVEEVRDRMLATLGPLRWGLPQAVAGFRVSVTFSRTITEDATFAYVDRGVRVRFYLNGDTKPKKEAEKANDDLFKDVLSQADTLLTEDSLAATKEARARERANGGGPVKRGRPERQSTQRVHTDDAAGSAAATDATMATKIVTDSDTDITEGRDAASDIEADGEVARLLAAERLKPLVTPMRRVLKVLTSCELSSEARKTALLLVIESIPRDGDAVKAMGEALEKITSPSDLQHVLEKLGGRPRDAQRQQASTWAAHLRRTPAPPALSALNPSTVGSRNKKPSTTRRSHSVSKTSPVSTNKPTYTKRAASRSRSGTRGW